MNKDFRIAFYGKHIAELSPTYVTCHMELVTQYLPCTRYR